MTAPNVLAFDTETALIRPALLAPPLVCVTWQRPGLEPRIQSHLDARPVVEAWLRDPDCLIVGHNVAYDLAVIGAEWPDLVPLIFDAYDADRVTDTQVRQQLLDIAAGVYRGRVVGKGVWVRHEYTLEALAKRRAGMTLQKDAWRLSYAEFRGVPLAQWPARAREVQARAKARLDAVTEEKERDGLRSMVEGDPDRCATYPLDDARATLAVYQAQEAHASYLDDQYRQARAAWALHLSSAWGLRTDSTGVDRLRAEVTERLEEIEADLRDAGVVRPDGTRDTKAAKRRMVDVCASLRLPVRRTDAHEGEGKCKLLDGTAVEDASEACEEHVCLDADACEVTEDPTLVAYAELSTLKKVLGNDVVALQGGTTYPIHTRYGLAETGRTTSSKPNIQNWTRARKCKACDGKGGACVTCGGKGQHAGVRECFIPRPGRVFAQADYPQLELYTLAQCCMSWLGRSRLAEALNTGLDPHLSVAAQILGVSYAEAARRLEAGDSAVDAARGSAKVANFGFPGGLGPDSLVSYAKKAYGQTLTYDQAKALKETWFATWPEMRAYFARVNAICDTEDGLGVVETLFTKRTRGGATYCAACNNGFQALGVDCAKEALWRVAREEYTQPTSPLWNARTVAFVHDELIVEVDDGPTAHDAAVRLGDIMTDGANVYLPDVPIQRSKIKPLLMSRWSKKARPTFGEDGRLVPWR